jgi:hypothetical protein
MESTRKHTHSTLLGQHGYPIQNPHSKIITLNRITNTHCQLPSNHSQASKPQPKRSIENTHTIARVLPISNQGRKQPKYTIQNTQSVQPTHNPNPQINQQIG